jgi:hypothetical protein
MSEFEDIATLTTVCIMADCGRRIARRGAIYCAAHEAQETAGAGIKEPAREAKAQQAGDKVTGDSVPYKIDMGERDEITVRPPMGIKPIAAEEPELIYLMECFRGEHGRMTAMVAQEMVRAVVAGLRVL